jgi:hypothetical protein
MVIYEPHGHISVFGEHELQNKVLITYRRRDGGGNSKEIAHEKNNSW